MRMQKHTVEKGRSQLIGVVWGGVGGAVFAESVNVWCAKTRGHPQRLIVIVSVSIASSYGVCLPCEMLISVKFRQTS